MEDYLTSISPLVLATLIVPTQMSFNKNSVNVDPLLTKIFRVLYQAMPLPIHSEKDLMSLALDTSKLAKGVFDHTLITRLFVHFDYEHLIANITRLVFTGKTAYDELGAPGFYILYFLSGVISALPWDLTFYQNRQMNNTINFPGISLIEKHFLNKQYPILCGCSSAVYAISSFSFVQEVYSTYNQVKILINKRQANQKQPNYYIEIKNIASRLLLTVLPVAMTFYKEFCSINLPQQGEVMITHTSHCKGIFIGCLVGLGHLFSKYNNKSFR